MKRRIPFVIVLLLLISSISINIYFIFTYKIAKTSMVSQKVNNANIYKKSEEPSNPDKEVENIFKNNPIDNFLHKYEPKDCCTPSMSAIGMLHRRLWKKEMEHAYSVLSNAAHRDVKGYFKESQRKIDEYAENEAQIACVVGCSDAFGDKFGNMSDRINYGTIFSQVWNGVFSDVYKKRTKELFRYCTGLGIKIKFVFNKDSLSKNDLALFKKK